MNSLIKKFMEMRMAHEVMMLDDSRKVLAESRRVVRNHNNEMLGVTAPEGEGLGDINIGDAYYTTESKGESKGSTIAKLALLAGSMLLGGGVGSIAVLPTVMSLLNKQEPPPQVAPVDDDFQLQLLDEPPPLRKSLPRPPR